MTQSAHSTHEKFYYRIPINGIPCFLKRNRSHFEFEPHPNGRLLANNGVANRIRNEKLAMDFVRQNTSIPVPEEILYLDEGDRVHLATKIVEGVTMDELKEDQLPPIMAQLDTYIAELS